MLYIIYIYIYIYIYLYIYLYIYIYIYITYGGSKKYSNKNNIQTKVMVQRVARGNGDYN